MRARILRQGEWEKLPLTLAPLFEHIDKRGSAVVTVEDGEDILACAALLNLPHVEGAWIAPSHRKNPSVGRLLLMQLVTLLREVDGWVLASTDDETIIRLFEHLGATPLPVEPGTKAFALDVNKKEGMSWPLRRRLVEDRIWE